MGIVHETLCYLAVGGSVAFIGYVAITCVAHAIDTVVELVL